jgi:N-acetylneuraminic acid mutarotase
MHHAPVRPTGTEAGRARRPASLHVCDGGRQDLRARPLLGADLHIAAARVYDPATDSWTHAADTPTIVGACAMAVPGKVRLIDGSGEQSLRPAVHEQDPAMDSWTAKANMPTPRRGRNRVAAGEMIYAIGGSSSSAPGGAGILDRVDVYDTAPRALP